MVPPVAAAAPATTNAGALGLVPPAAAAGAGAAQHPRTLLTSLITTVPFSSILVNLTSPGLIVPCDIYGNTGVALPTTRGGPNGAGGGATLYALNMPLSTVVWGPLSLPTIGNPTGMAQDPVGRSRWVVVTLYSVTVVGSADGVQVWQLRAGGGGSFLASVWGGWGGLVLLLSPTSLQSRFTLASYASDSGTTIWSQTLPLTGYDTTAPTPTPSTTPSASPAAAAAAASGKQRRLQSWRQHYPPPQQDVLAMTGGEAWIAQQTAARRYLATSSTSGGMSPSQTLLIALAASLSLSALTIYAPTNSSALLTLNGTNAIYLDAAAAPGSWLCYGDNAGCGNATQSTSGGGGGATTLSGGIIAAIVIGALLLLALLGLGAFQVWRARTRRARKVVPATEEEEGGVGGVSSSSNAASPTSSLVDSVLSKRGRGVDDRHALSPASAANEIARGLGLFKVSPTMNRTLSAAATAAALAAATANLRGRGGVAGRHSPPTTDSLNERPGSEDAAAAAATAASSTSGSGGGGGGGGAGEDPDFGATRTMTPTGIAAGAGAGAGAGVARAGGRVRAGGATPVNNDDNGGEHLREEVGDDAGGAAELEALESMAASSKFMAARARVRAQGRLSSREGGGGSSTPSSFTPASGSFTSASATAAALTAAGVFEERYNGGSVIYPPPKPPAALAEPPRGHLGTAGLNLIYNLTKRAQKSPYFNPVSWARGGGGGGSGGGGKHSTPGEIVAANALSVSAPSPGVRGGGGHHGGSGGMNPKLTSPTPKSGKKGDGWTLAPRTPPNVEE